MVIRSYRNVMPLFVLSSKIVCSSIAVVGSTDCWNHEVRPGRVGSEVCSGSLPPVYEVSSARVLHSPARSLCATSLVSRKTRLDGLSTRDSLSLTQSFGVVRYMSLVGSSNSPRAATSRHAPRNISPGRGGSGRYRRVDEACVVRVGESLTDCVGEWNPRTRKTTRKSKRTRKR
jgi:hypothetical protein